MDFDVLRENGNEICLAADKIELVKLGPIALFNENNLSRRSGKSRNFC